MPAERRGQAIAFEIGSTGDGRNPMFNGRRQPSCGGTSRMMREYQVRICERLGVKFPGSTRPERRRSVQRHVRSWCCVKKTRKRHAVREMKVDPSKSPCRGRLQTTISCFGQKP